MAQDLIKEKRYTESAPLLFEQSFQEENSCVISKDPYCSTIGSCDSYYAAKSLFVESEPEKNAIPLQDQVKLRENFLRRLTLTHIRKQIVAFFTRPKDTLSSAKDTSNKKMDSSAKKTAVSSQNKADRTREASSLSSTQSIMDARIQSIEENIALCEQELNKSNDVNMNVLMAMMIYLGLLGRRFSEKEIKDYMRHLQENTELRQKTYQGHTWTYVSAVFHGVAAVASLGAPIGAGLSGVAPQAGKFLELFGQVGSPMDYAGNATGKVGGVKSEVRAGERAVFEQAKENFTLHRNEESQRKGDDSQLIQRVIDIMKQAQQAKTEAAKRAAGG